METNGRKTDYYQQEGEVVRIQLNGHTKGLDTSEVAKKVERYGKNQLVEGKRKSTLQLFLEQFKDFLVIILIIAATVSGFLGDLESTIVILIVIIVNAILGTVQTKKAEQSLDSLKELSSPQAKVKRDGREVLIPSKEVTVGDEVLLEAGNYVPADGRLLEVASLKVDESALTGESLGVDKRVDVISEEVSLGDRINMVYSGSYVTYGRASYIVTNIGMETEVGKIASLLKTTSEKKTPLQMNLDRFGQKLSMLILVFCAILFGINVFRGSSVGDSFLFAVALAVAAIPEALSSIVTIVLSFGTQKMAKEKAIIRKLQAVEGLGSVSVICSDKTGTLTQNKMVVEYYYTGQKQVAASEVNVADSLQSRLLEYSVLCNDASVTQEEEMGDPTETALLHLAQKKGKQIQTMRNNAPRISELPFDSDRKMMSTLHQLNGERVVITKGAVDVLLDRLTAIETLNGLVEITDKQNFIKEIENQNESFSRRGLRVLAIAYRNMGEEKILAIEAEENLTFLGLIAMMDPPREESAAAVAECIRAGIRPVMITGDHKITAAAIAKKIGILKEESEACEGSVIDQMSEEELEVFVEKISVYARVSPEHKIRIVRAWQNKGNIVAMTGDGVNDAPALKQADIGVAMGITGSEVSKGAASMVLADDNFATIIKAVENGRNVYENIKKSIQFLLSGNFGAILTVLYAALMGLAVPFAPVHLLFINLLTDSLPAIALGLEKHDKCVMNEKPRAQNENILNGYFLKKIGIEGLCIAVTTTVSFLYGLQQGGAVQGSTMAFATLCLARLLHGFNCKAEEPILFTKRMFQNKYLLTAFGIGFVLMNAVVLLPFMQSIFKVVTLDFAQLLFVYVMAFVNFPVIQLLKKYLYPHMK